MARAQRLSEETTTKHAPLNKRLHEGLLLLVVALSIYLIVALVTYHRNDPGWSYVVTSGQVLNACGRVGAWLADFIFYICGYFAYIFPLLLCLSVWNSYSATSEDSANQKNSLLFALRALGFILIMCAGSALASIYLAYAGWQSLPFNSGGIIGYQIALWLLQGFNLTGSSIILIFLLLAGVTLFSGISWFQLAEWLGASLLSAVKYVMQVVKNIPHAARPDSDEPIVNLRREPKIEPKIEIPRPPLESAPKPKIIKPEKTSMIALDSPIPKIKVGDNALPNLSLLDEVPENQRHQIDTKALQMQSQQVEMRLADYGVEVKVVAVHPGPVVTRFELQLAAGTKVSKISALDKDLARSLSVVSVRVVEVIPGKSVIGLELPNDEREIVYLREVLTSEQYQNARSPLSLALGKDIAGHPVVVDLIKMPHLLVAGTTGSGKSVGLNAMLLSLLYKSTPKELRLILIDPKMLELAIYDGIPHLLTPVVTDMRDAASALRWCVVEMERRYKLMASLGVRNIAGYNQKVREAMKRGSPLLDPLWNKAAESEPEELQELPHIVVLADEFADMMVVVGKKIETLITRLAQKARAAGIHLIFATQRPSVDVITGLIKANIPTRIAFQVSSKIDSRTILDQQGADQLLGHGDMLYLPPGSGVPMRVHGAFVSDDEVHRVVDHLKQTAEPQYLESILDDSEDSVAPQDPIVREALGVEDDESDPIYDEAVYFVTKSRRVSISSIQRRFKIGYNRAARIVEAMEEAGVVSAMETNGSREVLAPAPVED